MIGFLLDTNVISEPSRKQPNTAVIRWLANAQEQHLYVSVITLGKIRGGIAKLSVSKKRERYELFFDLIVERFKGRIVPFDLDVAMRWGKLIAHCSTNGTPMPTIDSLLAATALARDLTVVTRNVADFRHAGVALTNPFG